MTASERAPGAQYVQGRKTALISGFTMLALFAIMQSSVLSRNLRTSGYESTHKEIPLPKFQLDPSDAWMLSLAGKRPRGDGDSVVFNPAALEKRESYEIKDNLKWHEGKPAVEKHPEAFEWYRYSEGVLDTKKKGNVATKRLLIAQYSNHGEFAEIYEMTKPVNMAYAEHWGHDIVFLNAQDLPTSEANLPTLLQLAWEQREKYDQLLLLDADAMMNKFKYDITRMFQSNEMMVAKRVVGRDEIHTWKIFGTVSLWNLRHLLTPRVQKTWSSRYEQDDPLTGLGEQVKPYETEVFTVTKQIENYDSAYIRTMQFATKKHGFRKVDPKVRLDRWRDAAKRACKKFNVDCSDEAKESRRASMALQAAEKTECAERREPTWEWRKHEGVEPKTKKRLLVAQYVSYGKYAKLLEMTAPINKLYAKMWNVDFVSVQGSTLVVDQDGGCEPPPQRAMYDKMDILRLALGKKDKYDQLLLLDADAMIYDMDFDVTSLAKEEDLLVAQRVSEKETRTHTDNVNNGIVLWNLHHPIAEVVSDDWYKLSRAAIEEGNPHGDQHYLQAVLRRDDRKQYVRSLTEEFRYRRGTVVKHFTRRHATNEWNNSRVDAREIDIASAVKEICEKFPEDCEQMEESSYQR
jgi:hypothetical protein